MKQKIGIVLEQNVLRRAKRRAADERRRLSDVIQDALERYLSQGVPQSAQRDGAYQVFCERPIRLTPDQLKTVLGQDSLAL